MTQAPLDHLLRLAQSAAIPLADLRNIAAAASCQGADLLDQLSLQVARAFDARTMSFDEADSVMNNLFGTAGTSEFIAEYGDMPALTFEVYLAFDDGEYCRRDDAADIDPVERYTRPQVKAILARSGSPP